MKIDLEGGRGARGRGGDETALEEPQEGAAHTCQGKPKFSNRWFHWEKKRQPPEYGVEA